MGNNNEGKFNVAVGAVIEHKASGNILLLKMWISYSIFIIKLSTRPQGLSYRIPYLL